MFKLKDFKKVKVQDSKLVTGGIDPDREEVVGLTRELIRDSGGTPASQEGATFTFD